jgi:ribonuclease HII
MILCGLDEAGRGPLAGPVIAGACILPDDFPVELLNDSKKLTEKKRLSIEPVIKEKALAWGIAGVDHETIDKINILQASLLAMKLAFEQAMLMLKRNHPELCINVCCMVDGTFCPDISVQCSAEPKADGKYPSVMAASILAKNFRDRVMVEYAALYPEYGYEKHKGYPTKAHREICHTLGPSPIQRKTFSY